MRHQNENEIKTILQPELVQMLGIKRSFYLDMGLQGWHIG